MSQHKSLHLTHEISDPCNTNNSPNNTNNKRSKSKQQRSFLRRKTQSETWSHTAMSSSTTASEVQANNNEAELMTNNGKNNNNANYYRPIKPSNADNAIPTSSTLKDIQRVLALIEEERHLVAHSLYVSVKERLDDYFVKTNTNKGVITAEKTTRKTTRLWSKWRRHQEDECQEEMDTAENGEAYEFYLGRLKEFEALEVSSSNGCNNLS